MLKILIADDHAIVRKGLREILRESSREVEIGEAVDGLEAMEKACARDWDVVVLDITMPGASGLEVLKKVRREKPDTPVLMLSMHGNPQYLKLSLKAGAKGYLTKEAAPEEFVAAIRTVIAGQMYVNRLILTLIAPA